MLYACLHLHKYLHKWGKGVVLQRLPNKASRKAQAKPYIAVYSFSVGKYRATLTDASALSLA